MQKTINILIVVALVAGALYLTMKVKDKAPTEDADVATSYEVYSNSEMGVEFDYPAGENGYIVEDRMQVEPGSDLLKVIVLFQTEDTLALPPEGGEGPAVITMVVFKNPKSLPSRQWAEENPLYSNIGAKIGEVAEDVIGGEKAIRYMADGLYASEFAVVSRGDKAYVINGQFIDENSEIRKDYRPLLESIRFIPVSVQN